jgi:BON domain-containing protein
MRRWSYVLAVAVVVLTLTDLAEGGDREVAEQIAGAIQASSRLRGYDIRVKFEKGTAWLRGRVESQEQMTLALALASQAKGVEGVTNGLTVRAEPHRRPGMAPVASPQPVDYAVEHARLVTRSVQSRDPIGQASQGQSFPVARVPVEPLRRPGSIMKRDAYPATVQKACYMAATSQVHVSDLHMATTLAGVAKPMLLPDESAVSTGEAFVSDGTEAPPVLLGTNKETASIPKASLLRPFDGLEPPRLIQSLPEPTRRIWAGDFREHGLPTMRASVDSQQ